MDSHEVQEGLPSYLHTIRHYLPAQAPLSDFIHHNTLHAFQHDDFHVALTKAKAIFGYNGYLNITEYRALYDKGVIKEAVLQRVLDAHVSPDQQTFYRQLMFDVKHKHHEKPRIGRLRATWKNACKVDMDGRVHPLLFRIVGAYLDQGVSSWHFPASEKGFLDSLRQLEKQSFSSIFRNKRARHFLLDEQFNLERALLLLTGHSSYFEQYLYDQQFAHPGWSGMVNRIEENPKQLIHLKKISLEEVMLFECLLEIDVLDGAFGENWKPLNQLVKLPASHLFDKVVKQPEDLAYQILHEAYEWSFYDVVLTNLQHATIPEDKVKRSAQAMFCMDDRECSIRRHLEAKNPSIETFGTPGHFNLELYYQPEDAQFKTKICPAPVSPKIVVVAKDNTILNKKVGAFSKRNQGFLVGFAQTFVSSLVGMVRLSINFIRPTLSPLANSYKMHMHDDAVLEFESTGKTTEDGLQLGFTVEQMAERLEGLLRSIGLIEDFAPLIYVIGHGSSSINNTHAAGYDCGACSGRPGSVNARLIALMGNKLEVRELLRQRGIDIPSATWFIGGFHDTSRDEAVFFDAAKIPSYCSELHAAFVADLTVALDHNAYERSRRFESVPRYFKPEQAHASIRKRTLSLFEPRPELNHATNAMAVVGRRAMTTGVFLDRRAFMNSYNYATDPKGMYLEGILNAVAPVAGGINLEYYFSRVDNQQLGAGSKLPHNVVGLFGVSNGTDGDLRTGLPTQMIEVHDPLRLLVVVEHFPEVVLETIQRNKATYNWFHENWVYLVVIHPETKALYRFQKGEYVLYEPISSAQFTAVGSLKERFTTRENITPFVIQNN